MKNKIVAFLSLITLSTLANTIVTTKWDVPSQVRDIVKANIIEMSKGVTYEAYPDAETLILDSVTYESYNTDGTSVIYDDTYTLILTEKGKRSESVASLHYNAFYGSIEIIAAEILQSNGNTVQIDLSTHAKIMVDPGYMGANIYDPNDKILRIAYPDLEIGDIVRLAFKRTNAKSRIPKVWSDYQVFETSAPIVNYSYYISSPNALPIKCNLIRDAITNTITSYNTPLNTDTNRTLHVWNIKNVPQYFPEPNMPPAHTVCQRLLLSTAAKWEEISSWYWNLSKPRLDTVTDEMRKTVKDILAKSTDQELNKIWNIFTWVSQNIRYMGVTTETEAPGYEPHNVSETFEKRYGVCRDKAALLVAMLRLAGIDAYPVLIHVGEKRDPQVPMTFFNHAIVGVRGKDGTYTLMDPTNENSADLLPAYLAGKSYLVATPEGETLLTSPEIPASANMVFAQGKGNIDANGNLTLLTKIDFDGLNDSVYRGFLIRSSEDRRRQFFEGAVKEVIPGANLDNLEILPENLRDTDTPLSIALSISATDYPSKGDKATLLDLPWMTTIIGYANFLVNETGLEKRRFPFETENACGVEESIELTLNNSASPIALPDNISFKTNGITFNQRISLNHNQKEGNAQIRAQRRFELNQTTYSPEQYKGFKDSLQKIEVHNNQKIVLNNIEEKQYDIRTLSTETCVNLVDNTSWTSTVSTVKQILTYAGRKNNSELKISYCPAMEYVEIIDAVVSNLNGQVHQLRPEEINIMDEGWVASAPRYPARKTFVVSLPGVEIGSIVKTSYRRVVTNAPFFHLEYCFQKTDPIVKNKFVLFSVTNTVVDFGVANILPTEVNAITNNNIKESSITVHNPPTLPRESNTPPTFTYAMVANFSSCDWKDYTAMLKRVICKATSPTNSKECAKKALELTKGIDDTQEKLITIRDYVMRNIRLAGPVFAMIPLQSTPADTILKDGYGNLFDRAIVMSALLSEAGIDNRIIIADHQKPLASIEPDDYPNYRHTNLKTFIHPLVEVDLGDGHQSIYLNDMNEYATIGTSSHNGHLAIKPVTCKDEGVLTAILVEEDFEDLQHTQTSIQVDKNGDATYTVTNYYFGSLTATIRKFYKEITPELLLRHHQTLAGNIAVGAKTIGDITFDIDTYPHIVAYSILVPNYAAKMGDTLAIPLEYASDIIPLKSDNRKLPILVESKKNVFKEITVFLPKQTEEILSKPENILWDYNKLGIDNVFCKVESIEDEDQKLIKLYYGALDNKRTTLPAEFAKTILEMNRKLAKPSQKTILIRLAK